MAEEGEKDVWGGVQWMMVCVSRERGESDGVVNVKLLPIWIFYARGISNGIHCAFFLSYGRDYINMGFCGRARFSVRLVQFFFFLIEMELSLHFVLVLQG